MNMKLIVGLGNPEEKYQNNRHNVGFQFLDFIIENLEIPKSKIQMTNQAQNPNFQKDKKLNAEICELLINNEKIILAKPQTFMNKSGGVIKKIIENCLPANSLSRRRWQAGKLKIENLFVIHDDLDLRLGDFKIQKGKGPKLHNGILSIEQALKTADFWRVRIGVDNRGIDNRIPGEKYVLQNFSSEELKILEEVFDKITTKLKGR